MRHRHAVALAAVAVTLSGGPLAAQRREVAVVAGVNYTGATGGDLAKSQGRAGFLAGVSIRLPRTSRFSFQTEFLVVERRVYGERPPSTQSPTLVGPKSDAARLFYAQIPLLLRFQQGYSAVRPVRPFLVLGPYLAIRMSCRRDATTDAGAVIRNDCSPTPTNVNPGIDPFIPAAYHTVDVGILGQFGVELRRFAVSLRGERSVTSLVEQGAVPTSPFDKARLWTGSVVLEYMLRVL
jgi:hypothetical protein